MCIVLLTTAHPDYALIVIDNRDEFILRPTSRPHWWTTESKPVLGGPSAQPPSRPSESAPNSTSASTAPSTTPSETLSIRSSTPAAPSSPPTASEPLPPVPISVLSARDLQRAERGTWLGITRGGNFAVLTNYRETNTHDASHPVHGLRSRGGMVTAWMAAPPTQTIHNFVDDMVRGGGVRGVGGFSLMCGKLRRRQGNGIAPLAVISNRSEHPDQVPWVADSAHDATEAGLSNACFDDCMGDSGETWPKIVNGKRLLGEVVREAHAHGLDEDALVARLFGDVLDRNTLPQVENAGFEEIVSQFRHSIFIPPVGDAEHIRQVEKSRASAPSTSDSTPVARWAEVGQKTEDEKDIATGFMTGMYGTQRQTVVLVDWEGNVRFTERALFDAWGREVKRGDGDVTFRFKVDGWDDEEGGESEHLTTPEKRDSKLA